MRVESQGQRERVEQEYKYREYMKGRAEGREETMRYMEGMLLKERDDRARLAAADDTLHKMRPPREPNCTSGPEGLRTLRFQVPLALKCS